MKPARRTALALFAALAGLAGLAVLGLGGALLWGLSHDAVRISIDGQPVALPPLGWPEGLAAGAAVLLAGLVLALLLPLVLLLGLGLPLLVVAGVAAALLGWLGLALAAVLGVLLAPLLLVAWAVRRRRARRAADATIEP
jgi:hypothetical protein